MQRSTERGRADPQASRSGVTPDEGGLDALIERQRAELPAPSPSCLRARETSRVRIPEDGALPRSRAWLERLYQGDLVVREKKPLVVDTRRSWGPLMASVDDDPLVVLDSCSQIATLTHGFAHPQILRALHEGRFHPGLWSNPDVRVERVPAVDAFVDALKRHAPPGLEHVSLVGAGGAEANEKAMRIARLHATTSTARRVLAFRGGFHGRTVAALMATWNPHKRGPFEFAGYESVFCEPDLESVERTLDAHADEIYAVLVEPMMSEGGDLYLPRSFFVGLVAAARRRGLPLIVDEVQTGFGTGGPLLWWRRLGLADDPETAPDLLTLAKKANLGVVLSRWPDPELADNQPVVASVIRGHIQLESAGEQAAIEPELARRAQALADAFPGQISGVRVAGTTFAFEVPDHDAQVALLAQRLHRGFMVYGAGERTIRLRLNASWSPRFLDDLFARMGDALRELARAPAAAPVWRGEGHERGEGLAGVTLRPVEEPDWGQIMAIERDAYAPELQGSEQYLRRIRDGGLGLVAVAVADDADASGRVLGFCFGGPVENYRDVLGPDRDPAQGGGTVFYSADVTVSADARGRGIGFALKRAQIEWGRAQGFRAVSGRNFEGGATSMTRINQAFGAYGLYTLRGAGGDTAPGVDVGADDGRATGGRTSNAEYYCIPLTLPAAPDAAATTRGVDEIDLASGLAQPLGPNPARMAARELVGPVSCRLNLSNYATPDVVQYVEHLRLALPRGMRHLYFTTSRDETVDKGLRCLRLTRQAGQIAIGLTGGYVGHITAAARSISDPRGFGPELGLFDWPRLPHPALGPEATTEALDRVVAEHGADAILGLVAEVVGERSGLVLAGEAAVSLAAACRRHGIPLILVETASGCYRGGQDVWGVDGLPPGVVPDMVLWYPGGQLGHVFVGDRYWADLPLTLISTWDGDELSIIRAHEHLRAGHELRSRPEGLTRASEALGTLLETLVPAHFAGTEVGGLGLYRTLTFEEPADASAVHAACQRAGLTLGRGLPGTLVVAPPLDIDADRIQGLRRRLNGALAAAAGREGAVS